MLEGRRLLRLYPRAWRERYGDEFLALVGDRPLPARHVFDILAGALDARLSRPHADARGDTPGHGGAAVIHDLELKMSCRRPVAYTRRDAMRGAGVMLTFTLACMLLGWAARAAGFAEVGEFLTLFGSTAGLMVSMPFWLMKGQPRRFQAAVVGGTLGILALVMAISIAT